MKKHLIAVVAVFISLNHQTYGMNKLLAASLRVSKKVTGVCAAALCKACPDEGSSDKWIDYCVYTERELVVAEEWGAVTTQHRFHNNQDKSITFGSKTQDSAGRPYLRVRNVKDLGYLRGAADIEVNMTQCTLQHGKNLKIVCGQISYEIPDVYSIASKK